MRVINKSKNEFIRIDTINQAWLHNLAKSHYNEKNKSYKIGNLKAPSFYTDKDYYYDFDKQLSPDEKKEIDQLLKEYGESLTRIMEYRRYTLLDRLLDNLLDDYYTFFYTIKKVGQRV